MTEARRVPVSEWVSYVVEADCPQPHTTGQIVDGLVFCTECGGLIGSANIGKIKRDMWRRIAKSRNEAWLTQDDEDEL